MSDITDTVRGYLEEFVTYGDPVADDTSLFDEGILDSLGSMEMIEFLEKKFSIKFNDEDVVPENLGSINQVVGFVEMKMEAA